MGRLNKGGADGSMFFVFSSCSIENHSMEIAPESFEVNGGGFLSLLCRLQPCLRCATRSQVFVSQKMRAGLRGFLPDGWRPPPAGSARVSSRGQLHLGCSQEDLREAPE